MCPRQASVASRLGDELGTLPGPALTGPPDQEETRGSSGVSTWDLAWLSPDPQATTSEQGQVGWTRLLMALSGCVDSSRQCSAGRQAFPNNSRSRKTSLVPATRTSRLWFWGKGWGMPPFELHPHPREYGEPQVSKTS